jgi:hypothetical protein
VNDHNGTKTPKPDACSGTASEIAKKLREADAKRWTQQAVGALLGVARETVRNWFTTNGHEANGSKTPKPDARVSAVRR